MKEMKKIKQPTYLESLANELLAKYRRLDAIIDHPLTKGSYHEKVLRDIVRSYLPSTFNVGEGFIINEKLETSTQLDILVVDNLDPRSYGYKDDNFYIAADLAVTCFGEVKTYCTKKEFITAFHNLVRSKQVVMTEPVARCTSFLFCYDAYASASTFNKWIDTAISTLPVTTEIKPWHFPNYVFCLQKKVMMERNPVTSNSIQYITSRAKNARSNHIQTKMIQDLFQCVNNGCGRQRTSQGINLLVH